MHILHTAPLNFVQKISFSSYNTLNILKPEETVLSAFTAHISVTLYNCSYGRSDCSLCLAAHRDYKCVWCEEDGKPSKCVYEKLCHAPPTDTCPHPEITRVRLLFSLPTTVLFFRRKLPSKLMLKGRSFFLGC